MFLNLIFILFIPIIFTENSESVAKELCSGDWTSHYRFTKLAEIAKNRQNFSKVHINGFHLTKDYCVKKFGSGNYMPKGLTTSLADDFKHLFMYITINTNENTTKNDLNFDNKLNKEQNLIKKMNAKYLLVIWLKEKSKVNLNSNYYYEISYLHKTSDRKGLVHTKNTKDFYNSDVKSDQILFKSDSFNTQNLESKISLKIIGRNSSSDFPIDSISTESSYIIVCAKQIQSKNKFSKYKIDGCVAQLDEEKNHITCECDRDNEESIAIITAAFWALFASLYFAPLLWQIISLDPKKSVNAIFSSCSYKNALYEYRITLRLGKASANFDLAKLYIDIEFFNEQKESLGPALRFPTSLLENKIMNDIPIYMFRLTQLPEIKKVHCNHSGPINARIYLFGFSVENLKNLSEDPESVVKQYKVHNYIVRDMRRLDTILKMEDEYQGIEITLNDIITRHELSYNQILWLSFVIFSIIGLLCFIFPYPVYRYGFGDTFVSVLFGTIIGGSFGVLLFYWTKYLDKKDLFQKLSMSSDNSYTYMKYSTYGSTIVISFIIGIILYEFGKRQYKIETFYWFCATFCSCSIIFSVWFASKHLDLIKKSIPEEDDSFCEDSSLEFES